MKNSKRQLLVVSSHSTVDLITNSSSELFVCNVQKSVEIVKGIIIELCKIHNQKEQLLKENGSLIDLTKVFTDLFKEPTICEYTIPAPRFWNQEEIFNRKDEKDMMDDWEKENPYPKTKSRQRDWEKKVTKEEGKIDKENSAYNKKVIGEYNKRKKLAHDKIFEHYNKYNRDAVISYINDVCKLNGFTLKDLGKIDINWDSYGNNPDLDFPDIWGNKYYGPGPIAKKVKKKNPALYKFAEFFLDYYQWGIDSKKGNILISSMEDNSIPYEMFEDLQRIFSASRHHLG